MAHKNDIQPVEVIHHKVELDEIKMHYVTAGKGEPLVLLHGFPQTSHAWRKVSAAVAAVLTRVLGRHIAYHPVSFEEQKQAMINVGLPEPVAEDNARAVMLMADGDCDYVTEDVASILGRPARSFEQFATDFAAAFS